MHEGSSGAGQALEEAAHRHADRLFLADLESDRRLTYREAWAAIARGRGALEQAGVTRGASVVTTLPDSVELVLAILTCLVHGVRLTLLGPGTPSPRMQELVRLTEPRVVIGQKSFPMSFPELSQQMSPGDTFSEPVVTEVTDEAFVVFSSGTTGLPKGVVHTHGNVIAAVSSLARAQELPDPANHLAVLSMIHVSGLYRSLLVPFLTGGSVHLWRSFSPERFWELAVSIPVHMVQLVPSHVVLLNRSEIDPPESVRDTLVVGTASAPLPVREERAFEERSGVPLLHGYGQTEATCAVTAASRERARRTRGCSGRPLPVNELAIVDPRGRRVPPGTPGEIAIRGANVATRWIGAPVPPMPDGWRRTGDLGMLEPSGELRVIGRRVRVINRGGEKIHPAEVEEALLGLEGVAEAAVLGRPHPVLGEDVVALLVADRDHDHTTIARALAGRLEAHKLPGEVRRVDALPRNERGKIPLPALRALLGTTGEARVDPDPVGSVWKQVLGLSAADPSGDFFHLGGSSLQAIQLSSALERRLGKRIPEAGIFDHPTLEGYRTFVMQLPGTKRPPAPFSSKRPPAPFPRLDDPGPFPLTQVQRPLWAKARHHGMKSRFNIGLRLDLRGPLDVGALERSLADLVGRHDALRMVMERDLPVQRVLPVLELELKKWEPPAAAREKLVDAFFTGAFDLRSAPLVRTGLLRLGPDHHQLLFCAHHLIVDGWSRDLLLRELGVAYRHHADGGPPLPPPPRMTFGRYARFATSPRVRRVLEQQAQRRRTGLAGRGERLELPAHLSPDERGTRRLGSLVSRIDAPTAAALTRLARSTRTSLTMLLTLVFERVLADHTGQHRFFLAVPVLSQLHPGAQEVIGDFANSTILVAEVPEGGWRAHLDSVRREMIEALRFRHASYVRVRGATPGIVATINVLPGQVPGFESAALTARSLPLRRYRNSFSLAARFELLEHGIHLDLAYRTPFLGEADVRRLVARYHRRLVEMLAALGEGMR